MKKIIAVLAGLFLLSISASSFAVETPDTDVSDTSNASATMDKPKQMSEMVDKMKSMKMKMMGTKMMRMGVMMKMMGDHMSQSKDSDMNAKGKKMMDLGEQLFSMGKEMGGNPDMSHMMKGKGKGCMCDKMDMDKE